MRSRASKPKRKPKKIATAVAIDDLEAAAWAEAEKDVDSYIAKYTAALYQRLATSPHSGEGHKGERRKNPAAVALSKLGAAKGGQARAKALSPRRRSMIAKKAAQARWQKPARD